MENRVTDVLKNLKDKKEISIEQYNDWSPSKLSKFPLWLVPFCEKYITFDLKKYRGVTLHDTEEWCRNFLKNWLVVWKMTGGIWQIFTRAVESVKIGTLVGSFCPN